MEEEHSRLTPFEIELRARPEIVVSDRLFAEDLSKNVSVYDVMQGVEPQDLGMGGIAYAASDFLRAQHQLAQKKGFFFSRTGFLPSGESFNYAVMTSRKGLPAHRTEADDLLQRGAVAWEEVVFQCSDHSSLYLAITPESPAHLDLVVLEDIDIIDGTGRVPDNIAQLAQKLRPLEGLDVPAERLYGTLLDTFTYEN